MKLLFENWRKYLNESLSVEDAECMALFSNIYRMYVGAMEDPEEPAHPDQIKDDIFDIVESDIPDVREIYDSIDEKSVLVKMEFLKELLLEHVTNVFIENYELRGRDVNDYIERHNAARERYKENAPPQWKLFLDCLETGISSSPAWTMFHHQPINKIISNFRKGEKLGPAADTGVWDE